MYASLDLTLEASFSASLMTDELRENTDLTDLEVEVRLLGKGSARWDVDRERVSELRLEGSATYIQKSESDAFGEYRLEFPGEFELRIENDSL